jgi:uncharacterized repeat protein (TIGR03803 family)
MVAFKKEGMVMANPRRRRGWILGIRSQRLATLAIAPVMLLAITTTLPARAQTFSILHLFKGHPDGGYPGTSPLVQDSEGNIYGTTELGGHAVGCQKKGCGEIFSLAGRNGKILYRFGRGNPSYGVIVAANGSLYGTASYGAGTYELGEVFEATTTGALTTVYSFTPPPDVASPNGGLTHDAQGNFYGVASAGGTLGYGGIFEIDSSGHETVLYSFAGSPNDAWVAQGNLSIDEAGNLYGTSLYGGPVICADDNVGCGTVFKLAPNSDGSWTESILYTFCSLANCTDGSWPNSGVILDKSGNLYGTTEANDPNSGGTVFKLSENVDGSWTESTLYTFCSLPECRDGLQPIGGLVFDQSGNLYGTTALGTRNSKKCLTNEYYQWGCGVVFKLDTSNNETVLHRFTGPDGALPYASLLIDATGNLYGTASFGGDLSCEDDGLPGCGVVFKLIP